VRCENVGDIQIQPAAGNGFTGFGFEESPAKCTRLLKRDVHRLGRATRNFDLAIRSWRFSALGAMSCPDAPGAMTQLQRIAPIGIGCGLDEGKRAVTKLARPHDGTSRGLAVGS